MYSIVILINQGINAELGNGGHSLNEAWPSIDVSEQFILQQATAIGTAYGSELGSLKDKSCGCW